MSLLNIFWLNILMDHKPPPSGPLPPPEAAATPVVVALSLFLNCVERKENANEY